MKKFLFVLIAIFAMKYSQAQSSVPYEFAGTIQLVSNEVITYKLNFKKQPDGTIIGTSLTDIYGEDRTTSTIVGSINEKSNTISFKETKNISTKSTSNEEEFCYIELNNAKLKTVKNKTIIQGFFVGKFSSGKKCASGNIYLVSTSYLNEIANTYINKKYIKNADTLKSIQNRINDIQEKATKTELRGKEELKLNWTSNEIIIEIWDGEREDLDEVGIFINDNKVIDRIILKQKKKTLILPFTEETCVLKIVGIDEGTSAPCTANILLIDNINTTPVVTVLKKGESTTIKLTRTK